MEKTDSMLEMIKMFYAYNSWATSQLINSLDQLNVEQLTAPGCSGNGSIRETLAEVERTDCKAGNSVIEKAKTAIKSIISTLLLEEKRFVSLPSLNSFQNNNKHNNNIFGCNS